MWIVQTQTLKNIAAVLEAAGSDFSKIVKLNVYLKSYSDFEAMNEVYITHFGDVKPVSTVWC
jgi:enamine deaminase RidA (YjgF/YER057c/UK114 family)